MHLAIPSIQYSHYNLYQTSKILPIKFGDSTTKMWISTALFPWNYFWWIQTWEDEQFECWMSCWPKKNPYKTIFHLWICSHLDHTSENTLWFLGQCSMKMMVVQEGTRKEFHKAKVGSRKVIYIQVEEDLIDWLIDWF